MSSVNNSSLKFQKNNVPLYRSAFNNDFRNDISYGTKTRYDLHRSISRQDHSEEDTHKKNDPKSTPPLKVRATESGVEELQDVETEKLVKKQEGYVGFANLPNQIYWKTVQRGFEFTLMVVGASGLGKSTLINSMFLANIYDLATYPGPTTRTKKTMTVKATRIKLKESGVNLRLTLVDTPGFGDAINNSESWTPVIEYIEDRYEDFFKAESKVHRKQFEDQRVHCCLYFIQPTGHGLRNLDIEFMKRLSNKVNIIPVIAKADTLTAQECIEFKKQILQDIGNNSINIYKFPDILEEDEEYEFTASLKQRVPFAVVGSNVIIEENGELFRGRKYPWGTVNISNLNHCDFMALRKMMISTHMNDLKDTTQNIYYEDYRIRRLSSFADDGKELVTNPFLKIEEDKRSRELKLEQMERDIEDLLSQKVRQKEKDLKDTEKLLKMRFEVSRKALEEDAKELDMRRQLFELEKQYWKKERLDSELGSTGSSKESIVEKTSGKRKSVLDTSLFSK